MRRSVLKIGPHDHGRPMSLEEFEPAEVQDGFVYELGRGVIVVSDVPSAAHLVQVEALRDQLYAYKIAHQGTITTIAAGSDCKILLADLESERHPDVAVYLLPMPEADQDFWSSWIPEIVIEVVSESSRERDYQEKPEEYLQFGVTEYWIVDEEERHVVVMRRSRGRWKEQKVKPPKKYRTSLLPGFELDVGMVFQAARRAR
jgi:Uma2 family endonuclease